jgi:hypothetical protein
LILTRWFLLCGLIWGDGWGAGFGKVSLGFYFDSLVREPLHQNQI